MYYYLNTQRVSQCVSSSMLTREKIVDKYTLHGGTWLNIKYFLIHFLIIRYSLTIFEITIDK